MLGKTNIVFVERITVYWWSDRKKVIDAGCNKSFYCNETREVWNKCVLCRIAFSIGWHCNHLVLGLGLCLLRLNSEELHQHLAVWHSLLLSWYAATQMVRLQSSHSHHRLLLLLHICSAVGLSKFYQQKRFCTYTWHHSNITSHLNWQPIADL